MDIADLIHRVRNAVHGATPNVFESGKPNTLFAANPLERGISGAASMMGPALAGAAQGDILNNHQGFFNSPAGGTPAPTQSMPPVQPLDDAPQRGVPSLPWWASGDMTKMFAGNGAPAAAAPAPAAPSGGGSASPQVPMPQARPAEAPQAQPDIGFFMRNALMMHDPATGQLIDPSGASSVQGPSLADKMMALLKR